MEQRKGSTSSRRGKHLNRNERILIEGFLKAGMTESNIVRQLGRDRRTIGREVERWQVEHLNTDLTTAMVYNADRAQDVYDENATAKGPAVKLKANSTAVEFIRCHIVIRRWSPEAVAARMKQKDMDGAVCAKTIYNHIDKGEIPGVSNETLWEKRTRGKTNKSLRRQAKRAAPLGRSIVYPSLQAGPAVRINAPRPAPAKEGAIQPGKYYIQPTRSQAAYLFSFFLSIGIRPSV